eukprot:scaffold1019_cov172-Amphora_coffeaeformis.AAC.7
MYSLSWRIRRSTSLVTFAGVGLQHRESSKFWPKGILSLSAAGLLQRYPFASTASDSSWMQERWNTMFGLLKKYQQREGHCKVPQRHIENGKKLGLWLNDQRRAYKKGKMDESRRQPLEDAGVSWTPLEDEWEEWFALLKKFKEREGHANVSRNHKENGRCLGIWLNNQRRAKKGQGRKLSKSQECRLEELGVSFDPYRDQWEKNFAVLVQYKEWNGHCNVPSKSGGSLGIWLHKQRYLKRVGKLDLARQHQLEEIGVVWDPLQDQWEQMFDLLVWYKERNGHCNVPSKSGGSLGIWLRTQRYLKRVEKLDLAREYQLEEIGVVWDPLQDQWEQMFDLLVQYKERNGHCNVPISHREEGQNLGEWIHTQRRAKRGGNIDESRARQLEELGLSWEPLDDQWESCFVLFQQYVQEKGHCYVPRRYLMGGKDIGIWLTNQWELHLLGRLEPGRFEKLYELGIRWEKDP